MPSPREKILVLLEELVGLQLQNLHICITSRPEIDIVTALDHLPFHIIALHEENGQKQDIVNYIMAIVYTDAKMKRWRADDKQRVIENLTRQADGM
jgi:hypothetical protein